MPLTALSAPGSMGLQLGSWAAAGAGIRLLRSALTPLHCIALPSAGAAAPLNIPKMTMNMSMGSSAAGSRPSLLASVAAALVAGAAGALALAA